MTTATRAAELDWWTRYLDHPTAKQRMWALYGARYYDFFFEEMADAGSTVEIGSGPLPVMEVMDCRNMLAVDPLGAEYRGLTGWPIAPSTEHIDVRGRWDTVLLLNVLDHADDPEDLIRTAHRLLRAGKRCLVYVHLDQDDDKHRPLSADQVRAWLLGAGFQIRREAILERVFEPAAYAAVATRPAMSDGEALRNIAGALDGQRWWLTCGAVLGYYRDGALIPWDHDIDVAIEGDLRPVRAALEAAGWTCWRRLGTPWDGHVMQFEHDEIPRTLDLYAHYRDGDRIWMAVYPTTGRRRYEYDAALFDRLETVEWQGARVRVPPIEYLEAQYGADWRTPRPEWSWAEDPPCLR